MIHSAAAGERGPHGTEPGGEQAKPIPAGIGEPDDPEPAKVTVRHPRAWS
jgi:hypothetical protein